jgi:hypothetical protein
VITTAEPHPYRESPTVRPLDAETVRTLEETWQRESSWWGWLTAVNHRAIWLLGLSDRRFRPLAQPLFWRSTRRRVV